MICLSLTAASVEEAAATAAREAGRIDLVELRADLLQEEPEELRDAIARFPGLCDAAFAERGSTRVEKILTIRRTSDGGAFAGGESERLRLLELGIESGYDWVDLEEDLRGTNAGDALGETARLAGLRIIRSLHDTEGMPADLPGTISRLVGGAGERPKVAVTPNGVADLRRLLSCYPLLRKHSAISVGMGPFGVATRILAPLLGSFLTYCSVGGKVAAPGHLDPETLHEVYGYRGIRTDTRVFGVIGNPVLHSKSPHFHNRVFRERGLNAVYVPFTVDDVDEFVRLAEELDIGGVSVTIPHKEAVIEHLNEIDDSVKAAGACNTLVRSRAGWRGINTDVPGFLNPLKERIALDGAAATVIGAGGAARGIVYALAKEGARVLVLNRTEARARELREELSRSHGFAEISVAGLDSSAATALREHGDLIVQTTSVGMSPNVEEDPLPWYEFTGSELVYDIVYTPEKTRLLARAQEAGCPTVSGTEMFRGQAEEQSRLFCELLTSA